MLEWFAVSQAIGFVLVLTRIAGFIVVSPFPGANVSQRQRAGLAVVLAWLASTYAPLAHAPHEMGISLGLAVAVELGCGLVIGCAFRFLYVAAQFLGQVVSQAVGLSMASVLNPTIGGEDAILTRIVTLLAELLALAAGVHRVAISYVLQSFRVLPIGVAVSLPESSHVIIDLVVRSITVGLQLGMPIVAVSLIVHIGLAMIARAAPTLQILHVGLSVTLLTGFTALMAALPDMARQLSTYYASLGSVMDEVLTVIGAPAP
jgi:flagellar biosynthetic protein FliR